MSMMTLFYCINYQELVKTSKIINNTINYFWGVRYTKFIHLLRVKNLIVRIIGQVLGIYPILGSNLRQLWFYCIFIITITCYNLIKLIKQSGKTPFWGVSFAKLVYCGVKMIKTRDLGNFCKILHVFSSFMSDWRQLWHHLAVFYLNIFVKHNQID